MAGLTYTEAREVFERDIFKPPHIARMMEVCGEFTGRLDNADRDYFLETAMEMFWLRRLAIASAADIMKQWIAALEDVAATRPLWKVSTSFAGVKTGEKWVKARQLRVKP